MPFAITIDGPAGAGKTSTARAIAKTLNIAYIDTGAYYRAFALHTLDVVVDDPLLVIDDHLLIAETAAKCVISPVYEGGKQRIRVNGVYVDDARLRTPEVAQRASIASTVKEVRELVTDAARKVANEFDCIMEGRDAGSVIIPKAGLKFYLTADLTTRAKRRIKQAPSAYQSIAHAVGDIHLRDERDTKRVESPLVVPNNAVVVDNTHMTLDETVAAMVGIAKTRFPDTFKKKET